MATYTEQALTVSLDGGDPLRVVEWDFRVPPVEYIRSLNAVKPDPAWRYTDEHGHEHRWASTDRSWSRSGALPTLVASYEHVPCDGSCGGVCEGEGYDVDVWHCVVCGERVEPGFTPDHVARTTGIPLQVGAATATLVVEEDPSGGDSSYRVFEAVLQGPDGYEARGKATIGDRQRRWGIDGTQVRVTIEMAILDDV